MLVAKYTDAKGQTVFAEVVRVAEHVQFDAAPRWILLAAPLHVKAHKRNRYWVPGTFRFEWVREIHDD